MLLEQYTVHSKIQNNNQYINPQVIYEKCFLEKEKVGERSVLSNLV